MKLLMIFSLLFQQVLAGPKPSLVSKHIKQSLLSQSIKLLQSKQYREKLANQYILPKVKNTEDKRLYDEFLIAFKAIDLPEIKVLNESTISYSVSNKNYIVNFYKELVYVNNQKVSLDNSFKNNYQFIQLIAGDNTSHFNHPLNLVINDAHANGVILAVVVVIGLAYVIGTGLTILTDTITGKTESKKCIEFLNASKQHINEQNRMCSAERDNFLLNGILKINNLNDFKKYILQSKTVESYYQDIQDSQTLSRENCQTTVTDSIKKETGISCHPTMAGVQSALENYCSSLEAFSLCLEDFKKYVNHFEGHDFVISNGDISQVGEHRVFKGKIKYKDSSERDHFNLYLDSVSGK